jgi:hypothetical protein
MEKCIQQEKIPSHAVWIPDGWFINLTKKMKTIEAGIGV